MRKGRDAQMGAQAATRPGSASARPPARRRCSARWAWRGPRWPRPARGQSREARGARNRFCTSCQLGNGIKHVVEITFDNVHFFRDNPNVPSDLELMPNLLDFFEDNGTFLSNNHTPLIAHTADDILTTLHRPVRRPAGHAGLEQLGVPRRRPAASGQSDPAGSFAYWTDPVFDTAARRPGERHEPQHGLLAGPPATAAARRSADHDHPGAVGAVHPGRLQRRRGRDREHELENTAVGHPQGVRRRLARGRSSSINDPDSYKDAEIADYVGVAVHCAKGSAFCSDAEGVKFWQTTPSATAVADLLPDEPGGPRATRRCSATVRGAATGRGDARRDPERLPGQGRGRQPGRPERQ